MERLVFLNLAMDEGLYDWPQEFLGNEVHNLGAHLIQNPLYDRLDQGRVRRTIRRDISQRGRSVCPE
jgi:hypothetical protein